MNSETYRTGFSALRDGCGDSHLPPPLLNLLALVGFSALTTMERPRLLGRVPAGNLNFVRRMLMLEFTAHGFPSFGQAAIIG
ncbi:MAG TPA: hypothetical protein VK736_05860 [Candidatus Binatia bacterium]|nr:hypothetical protein [Candidatus Binatia bacterium]